MAILILWYNGARTFFFVFLFGKNSKTAIGDIVGLAWGTLNLIGSAVAPEFKKSVYDKTKNLAYGAVDVVESGVESIGKGIHEGFETVKSVGKNVSDFFNGGLKAASSLFG